jgi:hypothetical protein
VSRAYDYQDKKDYVQLDVVDWISFTASLCTGLTLGLIRTMEPYFLYLIKKVFNSLFGVVMDEEELKKSKINDTYSAFLNSSLNIELVHIILKSITEECTKTSTLNKNLSQFIPCDNHFTEE